MKRKLSLLLAVVLAVTMMFGMSMTAMATDPPITQFDITVPQLTRADIGNPLPTDNFTFSPNVEYDHYGYYLFNANKELLYAYMSGLGYMDMTTMGTPQNPDWSKVAYVTECFETYPMTLDPGLVVKCNGRTIPHKEGTSINDCCDEYAISGGNCITAAVLVYEGSSSGTDPDASAGAHEHHYEWRTISEPSEMCDGLEGEVCTICGAYGHVEGISAQRYLFAGYVDTKINAAKPGQTVTFEFGEWNSFPKYFMQKLANKNTVNYVIKFKRNHKPVTVTIPAGTPIDLQFDWYGPDKMIQLYGLTQ